MDLQAKKTTLGELLGQNRVQLRVPPYQRPYAWGDEQIDDLWEDITAAIGSRHFIGSIVLSTEDRQAPQIIDGQQRLTTVSILLGLIRDRQWALGEKDRALGIQDDLLYTSRRARDDDRYALRLGASNWAMFRDLVLRPPDDPHRLDVTEEQLPAEEKHRNARLLGNRRRLAERLDDRLSGLSPSEQARMLADLEDVIVDGLELVEIKVGELSDAFLLFETLNDRGLQLSAADLLKNHLLGRVAAVARSNDAVEQMSARWEDMLDTLGRGVDLTRFFRHYLLVRHHPVAKEEVYDRFKKEVNELGPEVLMTELTRSARSYGDFEDPNRTATDEPHVAAVLRDLQTLRAVRCYVMLLPARRWLSSDDFVRVARRAEVLTYRYSSICGLDAKALELVYHKAAKALDARRQDGFAEAMRLLDTAMPTSEEFTAAFMRQGMGVQYLLRYTLARIEEDLAPGRERPVQLGRSHIEHVMPRTLTGEWVAQLGDGGARHEEFLHRWGNLTLLHGRLNEPASNKTLDGKRPHYRQSEVHLTRLLAEEPIWGYESIERRQSWLAQLADRVWPAMSPTTGSPGAVVAAEAVRPIDLPPELREEFEALVQEVTVEELIDLLPTLEVRFSDIEIAAATDPEIDVGLALDLMRCLTALVEDAIELEAQERSLVAAAATHFALPGNADEHVTPDVLGGAVAVADAVCRALGWDGLHARSNHGDGG